MYRYIYTVYISAVATGLPYGGNPVVGAVGEMASMKRRKLVVEDGGGWAVLLQQCHPNSAGPLIIARRTE